MEKTIILGLAGTRSLTETVRDCPENNLLICRHSFSISNKDKSSNLSHNQQIEGENKFEKNYYDVLQQLREEGKTVDSFTQGSNYGNTYISRYSGIKLQEKSCIFEGNSYDRKPDEECIKINNELADIFNNCNIKDFVIDNMRTTESREGFYGCFLHDVKVYFVACNFDSLKSKNIIISKELYIDNGDIVSDYRKSKDDILINEHIVNPDKIRDYSHDFNIWLRSLLEKGQNTVGCDYVCSDPGPGYKTSSGLKLIAQDVDDTITLKLLEIQNKPIKKLLISDETSLYSRSCFAISNFSNIINEISVFPNTSTELSFNDIIKDAVINKNFIVCEYINSEILKNLNLTLDKEKIQVFLNRMIEQLTYLSEQLTYLSVFLKSLKTINYIGNRGGLCATDINCVEENHKCIKRNEGNLEGKCEYRKHSGGRKLKKKTLKKKSNLKHGKKHKKNSKKRKNNKSNKKQKRNNKKSNKRN